MLERKVSDIEPYVSLSWILTPFEMLSLQLHDVQHQLAEMNVTYKWRLLCPSSELWKPINQILFCLIINLLKWKPINPLTCNLGKSYEVRLFFGALRKFSFSSVNNHSKVFYECNFIEWTGQFDLLSTESLQLTIIHYYCIINNANFILCLHAVSLSVMKDTFK